MMSKKKKNIPTKPTPDQGSKTTRRSFLGRLWLTIAGLALLEYVIIAADFLRPHRREAQDRGAIIIAGPIERFEPGSVTAFPQGKFYLARLQDGGFLALSRRCTHLGCTVPWDSGENLFVCPCHASTFAITGEVLGPPAPRPLDIHPVRIENGIVKINTGERIKRAAYEAAQVTRA